MICQALHSDSLYFDHEPSQRLLQLRASLALLGTNHCTSLAFSFLPPTTSRGERGERGESLLWTVAV
jgi:hypothetical protein